MTRVLFSVRGARGGSAARRGVARGGRVPRADVVAQLGDSDDDNSDNELEASPHDGASTNASVSASEVQSNTQLRRESPRRAATPVTATTNLEDVVVKKDTRVAKRARSPSPKRTQRQVNGVDQSLVAIEHGVLPITDKTSVHMPTPPPRRAAMPLVPRAVFARKGHTTIPLTTKDTSSIVRPTITEQKTVKNLHTSSNTTVVGSTNLIEATSIKHQHEKQKRSIDNDVQSNNNDTMDTTDDNLVTTTQNHGDNGIVAATTTTINENNEDNDDVEDMFAPLSPKCIVNTLSFVNNFDEGLDTISSIEDVERYEPRIGELLADDTYCVERILRRGTTSTIVSARVERGTQCGQHVAIKIAHRGQHTLAIAKAEATILERVVVADPRGTICIVRLVERAAHRGHLLLVLELLDGSVRDMLLRGGLGSIIPVTISSDSPHGDVACRRGIDLIMVRRFARQLFNALSLLSRLEIIHGDIRPETVLVALRDNNNRNDEKIASTAQCKLSAFACASNDGMPPAREPPSISTSCRSPETLLGAQTASSCDVWSLCCTLFEMHVGRVLFGGRTSNDVLLSIQRVCGAIPPRTVRRGAFWRDHFEDRGAVFVQHTHSNGNGGRRVVLSPGRPTTPLRTLLLQHTTDEDRTLVASFARFLERGLALVPEQRMTPAQALADPFLA